MKTILPFLLLLLVSCKTMQNNSNPIKNNLLVTAENCPENGNCFIELIPNSSIEFKKDEFDNSYPIISKGTQLIFKYTFRKNNPTNAEDSNYTEIIYAELNNPITETDLTNENLQTVKLHFGRLCYCKGETGYYPIKSGSFQIKKIAKDSLEFYIDFKQKKVPQLISTIKQTVSLKSTSTN